uniref:SUMO-activating enzyme subunit 1 n=1 Tax=Ditylenchus dipsaci TaxID=166011 RepID=A0A915EAW6_9BILA
MKMKKMTFDTNLYSRQMYAMGRSAMEKLREAKVLISGIGSVGLEISKNLILAGIGHVSIHDAKVVSWNDLSAQFYVTENDIGKNRAEASFSRLQELNDSVQCTCLKPNPLSEDDIKNFDLVIVTDASFDSQLEIDGWARKNGKRFISSDARGLFAYVFVDFGLQFCITDENGEACKEVILEHINCETGDVYTLGNTMHGFEDGDHVVFSEVVGASELNNLDPVPIRVLNSYTFNIGTIAKNSHPYIEGGRAKQVKVPKHVDFKTLGESLKNPDFLVWDFAKFDSPHQMHLLWQALFSFEKKYDRSPNVRSVEDAELLGSIMKAMNTDGLDIPEKSFKPFLSKREEICSQWRL